MYEQHRYDQPERKFSTGLPILVLLLSMVLIGSYLLVASELSNGSQRTVATVLPTPIPSAK
jgi:hypothetical protein